MTEALPNGRVQFRLQPGYPLGAVIAIPVTVTATRGSLTGPVTARIVASGIGERGTPSEAVVRELAAAAVSAAPGQPRTMTLSWDGRDGGGTLVPADAYVIVLEFRSDNGTTIAIARAAATIQLGP